MRHFLISALLLSLVAGCSSVKISPHRIDVQQGNALDQENVARLKPGLNRSQVRFLLGTPLVVDPFRTDRWDYVYVYYKAGKLAEQKRITLFFEGDTLTRIEGDLPAPPPPAPAPAPVVSPRVKADAPPSQAAVEISPLSVPPAPRAAPIAAVSPQPKPADAVAPQPAPVTSIVAPLSSPKDASPYVDRRVQAELSLQPETDVEQIKPDVFPSFSGTAAAPSALEAGVLKSLNAWADAWSRRDEEAYIAAYDSSFSPAGGDSRSDWEKRRRLLLGMAKNIDIRIEAPSVERVGDDTAVVTFNQYYRSDQYRDAVVKRLRMAERDGRWLIVEETVQALLRGARP